MKNKGQLVTRLISLCFLFALITFNATAQNTSPSLAETVDWMKGKVDELQSIYSEARRDEDSMPHISTWEVVSSNGCTLTLKNRNAGKQSAISKIIAGDLMTSAVPATVTFSFSDFNPQNIKENVSAGAFPSNNIRLYTTDSRKAVKWQISGKNSEHDSLIITFGDKTMAQRFTKAIKHAIELCGGKPDKREPF